MPLQIEYGARVINLLERFSQSTTLLPGLSELALAQFQQQLPGRMPEEIQQLLRYSAGFEYELPPGLAPRGGARQEVRFTGHEGFDFEKVFPRSIPLLPDGFGNFWIVDVNDEDGSWGCVFYACHDPAVIVVQAAELRTFLSQVLEPGATEPPNALHFVHEQAAKQVWRNDPYLVPVPDARTGGDTVVSGFARRLPDTFKVADLRSRQVGSGFSWGQADPDVGIRRDGAELIFGVEQKAPGLFKRIFRRTNVRS